MSIHILTNSFNDVIAELVLLLYLKQVTWINSKGAEKPVRTVYLCTYSNPRGRFMFLFSLPQNIPFLSAFFFFFFLNIPRIIMIFYFILFYFKFYSLCVCMCVCLFTKKKKKRILLLLLLLLYWHIHCIVIFIKISKYFHDNISSVSAHVFGSQKGR